MNNEAKNQIIESTSGENPHCYAWDATSVRSDIKKSFNLRLSEPYLLKLKFISENTPHSMQHFCLSTLETAIDQKIEELTKT